MNRFALRKTLALGALTGMRSMAGPAALAVQHGGLVERLFGLLAASEAVADKTSFVGNRIDPAPLAARALIGAIVGGIVASKEEGSVAFGGLLGAAAAVAAAHLAFHLRRRLPLSNIAAGLLEDALVAGLVLAAPKVP
jgi:uncharacterized membrane protein